MLHAVVGFTPPLNVVPLGEGPTLALFATDMAAVRFQMLHGGETMQLRYADLMRLTHLV